MCRVYLTAILFLTSPIMLEKLRPDKYLKYLYLPNLFAKRTKQILSVNPTVIPHREEAKEVVISVFDYNSGYCFYHSYLANKFNFRDPKVFWYEPAQLWIMVVALPSPILFVEGSQKLDACKRLWSGQRSQWRLGVPGFLRTAGTKRFKQEMGAHGKCESRRRRKPSLPG